MGLPADWYAGFLPQQQAQQEEDGASPEVAGGNAHANAAAPVLFVHMPRDTHTAALVAEDVELRKGRVSRPVLLLPARSKQVCFERG